MEHLKADNGKCKCKAFLEPYNTHMLLFYVAHQVLKVAEPVIPGNII